MKTLRFAKIRISQVKTTGGDKIRQRQKLQRVVDLASSMRDTLLIHPIGVDADGNIILGRDRFAAALINEWEDIWAHWIACNDQERRRLRLEEDIHRRHSEVEQRNAQHELLKVLESEIVEREAAKPKPKKRKPGRPKTPAGKAIDKVAKELGKTPEAIRMQEIRRKQKEEPYQLKDFELFGLEVPQEFRVEMAETVAVIRSAANHIRAAGRDLTVPVDKEYSVPFGPLNEARVQLERLAEQVGSLVPHSLCPHCKFLDEYVEQCSCCHGVGWISKLAVQGIPKVLWEPDKVCVRGEILTLEEEEDILFGS